MAEIERPEDTTAEKTSVNSRDWTGAGWIAEAGRKGSGKKYFGDMRMSSFLLKVMYTVLVLI